MRCRRAGDNGCNRAFCDKNSLPLFQPLRRSTPSANGTYIGLSRFWNPAAKGGADKARERNHRQHGAEASERESDGATGNADAATKKGAGVDNA